MKLHPLQLNDKFPYIPCYLSNFEPKSDGSTSNSKHWRHARHSHQKIVPG